MSSYDVRATMERRADALAACHEPRARLVPALSGQAEFAIAVGQDGQVSDVTVKASDLGDRTLEQCVQALIHETVFPRPHGGEARVSWTMLLEPIRPPSEPEEWDEAKLARVIEERLPDLRSECGVASQAIEVTAYVNRKGRLLSAGVATRDAAEPKDLDCVVQRLRTWPMPKPKHQRVAKLSFSLAVIASPRPTRASRASLQRQGAGRL